MIFKHHEINKKQWLPLEGTASTKSNAQGEGKGEGGGGVILPFPPPQNEPLKSQPRLGLKSDSQPPPQKNVLFASKKPFKNDEKCFSFQLKSSFRS